MSKQDECSDLSGKAPSFFEKSQTANQFLSRSHFAIPDTHFRHDKVCQCDKISLVCLLLSLFSVYYLYLIPCILTSFLILTGSNAIERRPQHIRGAVLRSWCLGHLKSEHRQCYIFVLVLSRWAFRRIIKESLGFCGRARKPTDTGAQLSNTVRAVFSFCCALCLKFERGSKNKGKLEQPVSSHCISKTRFHVVCWCLFILFWEDLYRCAKHRKSRLSST